MRGAAVNRRTLRGGPTRPFRPYRKASSAIPGSPWQTGSDRMKPWSSANAGSPVLAESASSIIEVRRQEYRAPQQGRDRGSRRHPLWAVGDHLLRMSGTKGKLDRLGRHLPLQAPRRIG